MAMALRYAESAMASASRAIFPTSMLLNYRNCSSGSSRKKGGFIAGGVGDLVEIEVLDGSDLVGEAKRLEEAIHSFVVRKAAPGWLPLRPGSSYWVPPQRSAVSPAGPLNLADLLGRIVNPMTEEESLSLTTARGWPSSSYYLEGASPQSVKPSPRLQQTRKRIKLFADLFMKVACCSLEIFR